MRVNRITKRIGLFLISFVIVVLMIIAILLNFIFTPQKITPKIVEILNENINGSVEIESVELTFFSSFPRFGLKVKEGSIFPNSLFNSKDTLANFSEA